jgi:hypothetical protein
VSAMKELQRQVRIQERAFTLIEEMLGEMDPMASLEYRVRFYRLRREANRKENDAHQDIQTNTPRG